MKYIIIRIEGRTINREFPILFPSLMVHAEVFQALKCIPQLAHATVVSAGEVSLFGTDLTTDGESETLGLKSRPEDAQAIEMIDYSYGAVE